jgi:ABC-type nitrate/sulfonate/bicarbonate transport system permease component
LILPKVPLVARGVWRLLIDAATYSQIGATLQEFVAALALSCAAGLFVGCLVGSYRYATDVFEPIIVALYAVPIIIIYPLCILFFGIGHSSKIAFAAVYGLFPIAINTINGLKNVDRTLVRISLAMGAGPIQLLAKVLAPAAWPFIVNGLRLAIVMEFLAVVAGETLAGNDGLGARISETAQLLSAPELFSWVCITISVSFAVSQLATLLGRLVPAPE